MGKKKGTKKSAKAAKAVEENEDFGGFEESAGSDSGAEVTEEPTKKKKKKTKDTSKAEWDSDEPEPGTEFNYKEVETRFATVNKYTFMKQKDMSDMAAVNKFNELNSGASGALGQDVIENIMYSMMNKSPIGEGGNLGGCFSQLCIGCPCVPRNCIDKLCVCSEDMYIMSDSEQKVSVLGPRPSEEPMPMFIGVNQPRGKWAGCISPSCGFCDESTTFWYVADQDIKPGNKSCCGLRYTGHSWHRDPVYPEPFMTSSQPGCCSNGTGFGIHTILPPSTCCPTLLPSQADKMTMWKGMVEDPFGEGDKAEEAHKDTSKIFGTSEEQTCLPCSPTFKMTMTNADDDGAPKDWADMVGPPCWGGCKDFCCIKPFNIEGLDGNLGKIKKRQPRSCGDWFRACCSDDNLYSIRPKDEMTAMEKAMVLAGASQLFKLYFAADGKPVQKQKIGEYSGIRCTLCHKFCLGMTFPVYCWCPYMTSIKGAISASPAGPALVCLDPVIDICNEMDCACSPNNLCASCCCCCACCCAASVDLIGDGMSSMMDSLPADGMKDFNNDLGAGAAAAGALKTMAPTAMKRKGSK